MCMITHNPFKRIATKDITCYKVVRIFSKMKQKLTTEDTWAMLNKSMDGGIKYGELTILSSGTSTSYTYRDDTYENIMAHGGLKNYDILYRSPYRAFILPEFGENAEWIDIAATQIGWNPLKREVSRGYHSFVYKEDAIECMHRMAYESRQYYEEVCEVTDNDVLKYFDVIECVIPRGRIYMKGIFEQTEYKNYVSSSFKSTRSLGLSGEIAY